MWRFLINLEVVTYDRDYPSETYLKDLTSEALSRLHLSSKSFLESRRIRRFLMNLEIVLSGLVHPQEDYVKVSSRSIIRNPVKTQPISQVSF